ncbi:MAG: hypothetical protein ACYDCP_05840 [Thermoplasmataceae archaeon]
MSFEKTFYSIIAAIVVVGGVGIGAVYYHSVAAASTTSEPSASITLVITPNNWFHNSTINHRQPAYYVLEPNGTLGSSANIILPAHRLISITIIDYDSGASSNIGVNGSSNNSTYAHFIGTVGNVGYVYNGTPQFENGTLSGNSTNNISINHGSGWKISGLPWNNTLGGWEVTHTFTIIDNGKILVNIPSWAGINPDGGAVTHASFYLNQTGTFLWQCYAPCGEELNGWGGAMATAGWMLGSVSVQ